MRLVFDDKLKKIVSDGDYKPVISLKKLNNSIMNNTNAIRNCAFQYYNGRNIVSDKYNLTLEEAKELWNKYYADMVEKATDGEEIEVAIWINMENECDYRETLVNLSAPEVRNGKLYQPEYYGLF